MDRRREQRRKEEEETSWQMRTPKHLRHRRRRRRVLLFIVVILAVAVQKVLHVFFECSNFNALFSNSQIELGGAKLLRRLLLRARPSHC